MFFKPIKIFQSNTMQKKTKETKCKESFVEPENIYVNIIIKICEYYNKKRNFFSWEIFFQNAQKYT